MTHNNSTDINEIETMSAVVQAFPQLIERLRVELEILTGKKAKTPPPRIELEKIEYQLRKLALIVKQFRKLSSEPLNPKGAQNMLRLVNRVFRLIIPRIPRNREPLEYVIQIVKRQAEIPNLSLPEGLDYEIKHLQLQDFISEIVSSVESSQINACLHGILAEHQLVAPVQRAFGKLSFPKELSRIPSKISLRTSERLKLALREVIADWEALINLVYGLYLLKQGQQPTWVSIRREPLWNKVTALRQDSRLAPLAKQEWVTVRNSLAHGSAFFDPNKERLECPNRSRRISWSISTAYFEGRNIFLANLAMLKVYDFVCAAEIRVFEIQIESIRELASQS